jgi:MscS family membrane protein
MKKTFRIFFELLLVAVIIYLKYYNHVTSEKILASQPLRTLLSYVVFFIVIRFFSDLVKYYYSKKNKTKINVKNNIHYGIENITKLLLGVGLLITISGIFGIELQTLITSLSIVAAAIAIISKEYINDFLGGINLIFSKDFEINDYVKLEEHKGKIIEINMFKIKILNENDDIVIIPNGKVNSSEIINYTKRDIRLMSIDFQIDIKLISSIELLEKEIISALTSYSEYIEQNSYNLKIVEMKKDYLDLKFQYTLNHIDTDLLRQIRKKTVREIFNYISSKN